MIAAIYARKSTEQAGVADEQKSVTRQIAHAREYAQRKGWAVDEAHVYVDDGISGAEFANRPGFLRLMNALKPRPPFQVLVMSEVSRLGREQIETAFALKQLSTAGVRCFGYLDDRELLMESATDKFLLSAVNFAAELEREKGRQRTSDAMIRIARAGHVTGGAVFGYANVTINGPDGRRSHVERRIREDEASVVRRIFQMCADGYGLPTIAKSLNEAGAHCPRSQQGRPSGWAPSSVREVVRRELYRGVIVWNKTRKRNRWGQVHQRPRAAAEWLRLPAPHLAIVSETLWNEVQARLETARTKYLRATNGQLHGRLSGSGTKYLLSGLLVCGRCGSSLVARTRSHGRLRVPFYGCGAHKLKGNKICRNDLEIPMAELEDALLETVAHVVLDPSVTADIVTGALEQLQRDAGPVDAAGERQALEGQCADLQTQIGRLTESLAIGGDLRSLVDAIRRKEQQRAALTQQLARLRDLGTRDLCRLRRQVEAHVREWRTVLRNQAQDGQRLLRRVIVGRVTITPEADAKGRYVRYTGQGSLSELLTGAGPLTVASPTGTALRASGGFDFQYKAVFFGKSRKPKRAA